MTSSVPTKLFTDAFPASLKCEYCLAGVRHQHPVTCDGAPAQPLDALVCGECEGPMVPSRVTWRTEGWLFGFAVYNVPALICGKCGVRSRYIAPERLSGLYAVAAAHYRRGGQAKDALGKIQEQARWRRIAEQSHPGNALNELTGLFGRSTADLVLAELKAS